MKHRCHSMVGILFKFKVILRCVICIFASVSSKMFRSIHMLYNYEHSVLHLGIFVESRKICRCTTMQMFQLRFAWKFLTGACLVEITYCSHMIIIYICLAYSLDSRSMSHHWKLNLKKKNSLWNKSLFGATNVF